MKTRQIVNEGGSDNRRVSRISNAELKTLLQRRVRLTRLDFVLENGTLVTVHTDDLDEGFFSVELRPVAGHERRSWRLRDQLVDDFVTSVFLGTVIDFLHSIPGQLIPWDNVRDADAHAARLEIERS